MPNSMETNNQVAIQQGALATNQDEFNAANLAALKLLADPNTFDAEKAFKLLNALGAASPLVRQKLGPLFGAKYTQIVKNPLLVTRLQQICVELAQDQNLQQQIEQDLQDLKLAAQDQANTQKQKDTDAIKAYLDQQRANTTSQRKQAVIDENVDTVNKIHEAKRDKGVFGDPLTVLGILCAIWLELNVIVPVDEQFSVNGYAKGFKYNPVAGNSYVDQLRKENGGDVIFPGAVPTPVKGMR